MGSMEAEESGIGIPPVVRLMRQLRNNHISSDELPLTVKDARLELRNTLKNVRTAVFTDTETAMKPLANVERLWFSYGDRPILRNINLTINEGEFIAIMGRNASGKSTLVKHLNGLLHPVRGKVTVNGIDTTQSSVAMLSRQVGYVFQNPNDHLFADTVEAEIAFNLKNRRDEPSRINRAVDQALTMFRLTPYRHVYPRYLSGGEKQRVALASVMVGRPKLIILDEPTRGMDYALKKELVGFLEDYCRQGNAVVMVTHDVEIAAECADRVILLSEGKIVVEGRTREVLSKALLFSPQINRLAQALSSYGISDTTLTVDEMLGQVV